MSKGKYFFNRFTIFNNLREILPQLISQEGVNVAHPTFSNGSWIPFYQFKWGERPSTCEQGKPICYAFPEGRRQAPDDLCNDEHRITFNLGILAAGDDRGNQDLFYEFYDRLHTVFGRGGIGLVYDTNDVVVTTLPGVASDTLEQPFTLGQLGVNRTEILSAIAPRRLDGDTCSFYWAEMLVEWSLYFRATKQVRFISE